VEFKIIIIVLGLIFGANQAVEHVQEKAKADVKAKAEARLVDENLVCGVTLVPPSEEIWEVDLSLRQMLSDEEWAEYVNFLLARKYSWECMASLMQAATHSWGGGELPSGLVKTYNEFLEEKEKKRKEEANQ